MDEIKNFILANWQLIASVILFIIATVISLIRAHKKGYNLSDVLAGLITEELPNWIAEVEGTGTGEQKKVKVLNYALSFASKKLGRQLSEQEVSLITTYVTGQIEKILATPQKKEVQVASKGGKRNATKYR